MKDLARSIDWLKRMNPAVASAQQDEIPRSPAHRFSEDSWHLKRCTTILPLLDCWQLLAMSLAGSPGNAQGCSSGDQEETFSIRPWTPLPPCRQRPPLKQWEKHFSGPLAAAWQARVQFRPVTQDHTTGHARCRDRRNEFRPQFGSCWGRMDSTQRGSSVPSIAKTATSQSLRSNMSGDYHPLCHIQSRTVASGVTFKLNTLGQPLKRCESCVIGESNSSQVWRPSESSAWCSCTKGILCCCVQRESPVCWRTVTLRSILITYTSWVNPT